MLIWRRAIRFFFLFWIHASAEKQVNTWFVPVSYKPPQRDIIFNIQTSSGAHCRYMCMENQPCLVILYSIKGLFCKGYKSQLEHEPTIGQEKVWKIAVEGVDCNLAMEKGTTCTVSSKFVGDHRCNNVYDGITEPGMTREWGAQTSKAGEWIKIIFRSLVLLRELELWHRCNHMDQARRLELKFSIYFTSMVNRVCDGSNSFLVCNGQARISRHHFTPAIFTEWLKITSIESCYRLHNGHFGFIEIRTFGLFVKK